MSRCSQCNTFRSGETQEPEFEEPEFDPDSNEATCSVTITDNCTECSTEMRTATLDLSFSIDDLAAHGGEGCEGTHELSGEVEGEPDEKIEGKGRGMRTSHGVVAKLKVTCSCGWTAEAETGDHIQVSQMDES